MVTVYEIVEKDKPSRLFLSNLIESEFQALLDTFNTEKPVQFFSPQFNGYQSPSRATQFVTWLTDMQYGSALNPSQLETIRQTLVLEVIKLEV